MRILYIYRDDVVSPGRKKYFKFIMEQLGHEVILYNAQRRIVKNQLTKKYINKFKPDFIFFIDSTFIKNNFNVINYAKSKNILIGFYGSYYPREVYYDDKWMGVWKSLDFIFSQNKIFHEFLKRNDINSYYLPSAFHTEQYYKILNDKVHDVSFCGRIASGINPREDKRVQYIRSLKRYNIVVYGDAFKGNIGKIPVYSYDSHKRQLEIYSKTKINLGLVSFSGGHSIYKKTNHIKNRFFEIPATGNFLLTCRCPEFLDIFDEGIVGYYDDNTESLKENVNKYLKDKKLRRQMTERAYKLVHAKHTFKHRFKEMFKIIEK